MPKYVTKDQPSPEDNTEDTPLDVEIGDVVFKWYSDELLRCDVIAKRGRWHFAIVQSDDAFPTLEKVIQGAFFTTLEELVLAHQEEILSYVEYHEKGLEAARRVAQLLPDGEDSP